MEWGRFVTYLWNDPCTFMKVLRQQYTVTGLQAQCQSSQSGSWSAPTHIWASYITQHSTEDLHK